MLLLQFLALESQVETMPANAICGREGYSLSLCLIQNL